MAKWTYEATQQGYANMWASISIKGGADARNANFFAKKIIAGEEQYREVQDETGVPWYFVGALHMRESGCRFDGVLHNGDKIIGTRRKTYRVPKGHGPFATWKDSAVHVLVKLKRLNKYTGQWCPALIGFISERFNGLGYVGKGVNSAYLWAGSNHEQLGKYIADSKWDKDHDDTQIGTMTVLKALCKLRPDIAKEMGVPHMTLKKKVAIGVGGAAGTGAVINEAVNESTGTLDTVMSVVNVISMHGTMIATVFTVAVVVGAVGWHFYGKWEASRAEAGA